MTNFSTIGSIVARFWDKVDVRGEDECWIWIASTNGRYGRFYCNGSNQQSHRVAYAWEHNGIPDGLHVLHRCDNELCVNPRHLFAGTQQDNVNDMITKSRQSFGGERPLRGSASPLARLTEAQVIQIKEMLAQGHEHKDIAADFGVARQTITNISTGVRWGWLQPSQQLAE